MITNNSFSMCTCKTDSDSYTYLNEEIVQQGSHKHIAFATC